MGSMSTGRVLGLLFIPPIPPSLGPLWGGRVGEEGVGRGSGERGRGIYIYIFIPLEIIAQIIPSPKTAAVVAALFGTFGPHIILTVV